MLNLDFNKHRPGWKLAALFVDRLPHILSSGALFLAVCNYGPVGARWAMVFLAKHP